MKMKRNSLDSTPYQITESEGILFLRDVPITNFTVRETVALFSCTRPEHVIAVELEVIPRLASPQRVILECGASLCAQIERQVPTCKVLRQSAQKVLDAYFLEGIRTSPVRQYYIQASGLYQMSDGHWIYACGDEVLGADADEVFHFAPDVAETRLVCDPDLNLRQALGQLFDAIQRHPKLLFPVYGYTLVCSLRSQLIHRFSTFPSVFLDGIQGVGKTVLAQRYTQLFAPATQPCGYSSAVDGSSTSASIRELLIRNRDRVVLVDDLAKGSDPSIQRERTRLMAEILRSSANNSTRTKMALDQRAVSQVSQAGLVFTGEVSLNAASDITRLIHIRIKTPLRDGSPADRTCAATVFRGWMTWLLPQLDRQLELLDRMLAQPSETQEARLDESMRLLFWGISLLLEFALDREVINQEYAIGAQQYAKEILQEILSHQEEAVERIQSPPPQGNISWYILDAYHNNQFHVVDKQHAEPGAECIFDKGALCIRPRYLAGYLNSYTPYRAITEKGIGKQLRSEGVLPFTAEKRSADKRICGHRYLKLPLEALRECSRPY